MDAKEYGEALAKEREEESAEIAEHQAYLQLLESKCKFYELSIKSKDIALARLNTHINHLEVRIKDRDKELEEQKREIIELKTIRNRLLTGVNSPIEDNLSKNPVSEDIWDGLDDLQGIEGILDH